jgi:hypothetical protein
VPAAPTSSRIPTAAQQLDAPLALAPAQCRSLLVDLAIGILRAHGHRNIAAALRTNARDATRVLPLLGVTGS